MRGPETLLEVVSAGSYTRVARRSLARAPSSSAIICAQLEQEFGILSMFL